MAIKRLNYDRLISGAVSPILSRTTYSSRNYVSAFGGKTPPIIATNPQTGQGVPYSPILSGMSGNPYFYSVLEDVVGTKIPANITTRGDAFDFIMQSIPRDEVAGAFSRAYAGAEAYRQFAAPGIPVGTASFAGTAPAYEKNVFGETIPQGTFISGPNIKKLGYSELLARGSLPLYEVSAASGNMVSQAKGLTFTEKINLSDLYLVFGGGGSEVALQDVPKIYSPAESIFTKTIPNPRTITQTPSREQKIYYESYISALPQFTKTAIDIYKPGTRSGLAALAGGNPLTYETYAEARTGALGPTQTTGNLGLDISAGLARNEYQQQAITAIKISELKRNPTETFKELAALPMAPSYDIRASAPVLPSPLVTSLQSQGPIKVNTVSIPKFGLERETTAGNVSYAGLRELAGIIQGDKEVYKYKDKIVTFNVYNPRPTLLPR